MKKLELILTTASLLFFLLLGFFWKRKEETSKSVEEEKRCEANAATCYIIGVFFFVTIPILFLILRITN